MKNSWCIDQGNKWETVLKQKDIDAVFLDSKRIHSVNGKSREKREKDAIGKVLNSINENSRFDDTVLIATSALDNGISIEDPAVKNVVIASSHKTTFIQMLGRIRYTGKGKILA